MKLIIAHVSDMTNTEITPSSKTKTKQRRQWKKSKRSGQESASGCVRFSRNGKSKGEVSMNDNIFIDDLIGIVPDDAWVKNDEMKEYLVASIEINVTELLDEERSKHEGCMD